ncbi:MAG TPA: chorismate-binding protein, partial [Anaerolineales bacterium]
MKTNEVLLKNNNGWLYFSEPHHIVTAHGLGDVVPSLHEIERLVESNNWHAAGFLSYEAAPAFDSFLHVGQSDGNPSRSADKTQISGLPLLWFGLYPAPRLIALPEPVSPKETLSWLPTTDRDTYNAAIEQVKDHIAHGHTYQVNYTMRLQAEFKANPWNFFLLLAQTQNNHAAYIDIGRYAVASASPELFFQLEG